MSTDAHRLQHDADLSAPHDHALIARALSGRLRAAYQPIVELGRGTVLGYEARLRYDGAGSGGGPFSAAELFASAQRLGRVADVEAVALATTLDARHDLPDDCHLFVKVGMESLADERVDGVLRAQGDLGRVVLELSGDTTDADALEILEGFRDRGARVAVVDPPLDVQRLDDLMIVGPGFFTLDRRMIAGISASNTRLALVDSVRHLADRLGIGLIAQGIEDLDDLRSLARLGIGFGQGYLIARPSLERRFPTALSALTPFSASFTAPFVTPRAHAETAEGAPSTRTIDRLVEAVCELTEDDLDQPLGPDTGAIEFEVLVTELREPLALLRRVGRRVECLTLATVEESASLVEAVRIAMRRPRATRFEPLVCVDQLGATVGVVRIERIVDALATADRGADRGPDRGAGGAGRAERGAEAGAGRTRHAFDFSCRPPRRRPGR